jgi:hypothetical protein
MPTAPLAPASAFLLLTVGTREDAREAVAAASDAEGVRISISQDLPLGFANDISTILYNAQVQNRIIDHEVLAKKVSQENWLMKEIENAEMQLEHLKMLLRRPWLP